MVEQADAYYSHAMEHIEPLLAHEVPTSRNEGSSAYLQQLWHQARTQGFEISASRLTNAWLLGGRQVGLACELEKQAVSLGLEICSSYSSSPSGSAGLDAPEAATILRLSKALLARAIGMATSSSPADNSAHSVGTGPEDQARLVEAALQLASAMEQVGKIRGSDEMTSPPHPVYDFAEDLKIKALTMLAALRLDMGTPESIASARRLDFHGAFSIIIKDIAEELPMEHIYLLS